MARSVTGYPPVDPRVEILRDRLLSGVARCTLCQRHGLRGGDLQAMTSYGSSQQGDRVLKEDGFAAKKPLQGCDV